VRVPVVVPTNSEIDTIERVVGEVRADSPQVDSQVAADGVPERLIVDFPIRFRDRAEGVAKMSGSIIHEPLLLVVDRWVGDSRGRRRLRVAGR